MQGILCLVVVWGLVMLTIRLFKSWFGKKKKEYD